MRVQLINPQRSLKNPKEQYLCPPIGLASLASFLQINGHVLDIIDTPIEGFNTRQIMDNGTWKCGLSDNKILERIKEFQPDIVGISATFTARLNNVISISKIVKQYKDIPVMAGGMHATCLPQTLLKEPSIDFVILGEGELPILNLLNKLKKKDTDYNIQGIGYKKEGNLYISNERLLVDNLSTLPMPAYDLLPMDMYFKHSPGRDALTKHRRCMSVITSRGCPNQCTFCSSQALWSTRWRAKDPSLVLNEIENLVNVYKIREISFEDDNLTLDYGRADCIFREMIHRNLQVEWNTPNGVAVQCLDRRLIRLMKHSGCTRLHFGIESGDNYILHEVIRKNTPLEKTKEVVRIANEEGITTIGYFVIGMPGETDKSLQNTLDYAKSLALDEIGIFIAVPYPLTSLENICKQNNYLKKSGSDIIAEDEVGGQVFIETPMISTDSLLDWKSRIFKEFYNTRIRKNPLRYALRAIRHPHLIGRFLCES